LKYNTQPLKAGYWGKEIIRYYKITGEILRSEDEITEGSSIVRWIQDIVMDKNGYVASIKEMADRENPPNSLTDKELKDKFPWTWRLKHVDSVWERNRPAIHETPDVIQFVSFYHTELERRLRRLDESTPEYEATLNKLLGLDKEIQGNSHLRH